MTRPIVLAVLVAGILLVPSAAAGPVYDLTTPGVTSEDDGVVVNEPRSEFEGRANRVVYPGSSAGDGGLFLDARLSAMAGGVDLYPALATQAVLQRSNILLPGPLQANAWYGWWLDLDADGNIADLHDKDCAPDCALDEFAWRGDASSEKVGMHLFIIPFALGTAGGRTADPARSGSQPFEDRTSREGGTQEWLSEFKTAGGVLVDASTLATIHTLVVAGATKIETYPLYDLDDPAGLHDVDRYEALNPDAETLWSSVLDTPLVIPTLPPLNETATTPENVTEPIDPVLDPVLEPLVAVINASVVLVNDTRGEVARTVSAFNADAQREGTRRVNSALVPPYAKEPNHVDDDHEGRALFGGVGDFTGSHNSYEGYRDGFHFYADNRPLALVCPGYAIGVSGIPVGAQVPPTCVRVGTVPVTDSHDVAGAQGGNGRTPGTHLVFEARPLMWKDLNGDGHLGTVCDPGSTDFDGERNTCRIDASSRDYPSPHAGSTSGETTSVCPVTIPVDGVIRLTPIGGDWPDVIVWRDAIKVGSRTVDAFELHSDSEPIEIRWNSDCLGTSAQLRSRDSLIFPTGSPIAVHVDSAFRLPAFKDVARGIDVTNEYVRDVDILAATL